MYVQRIFFEIYHLVNMVHELPRKYANISDFADPEKFRTTPDPMEEYRMLERIKNLEKIRNREKKQELKRIKKSNQLLKAAGAWAPAHLRTKANKKKAVARTVITVDTERPIAIGRTIASNLSMLDGNQTGGNRSKKQDAEDLVTIGMRTRRPVNRWWPIDYGWEINYYW